MAVLVCQARPVGIDKSPARLVTAQRAQQRFGLERPLQFGNAEQTELADASFDLVVGNYGASVRRDPYRWLAEAARPLRPDGVVRPAGET
ncbi:MAG TPA: class I SAM-dependent methyltransferase [Thermomicrobiales bacterium]|nr:class I SAM-dependent methyltransferase [Thermomicrobiales bacterium]